MSRPWEKWDSDGVADTIEAHWESDTERAHRRDLADLVTQSISGCTTISLLEVGCGSGRVYERLVENPNLTVDYVGIDVSLNMLAKARHKFPAGRFLYGDGNELVFRDSDFDVVVCFEVLGHVPHIEQIIAQMLRVARKICIFTIWPSRTPDIVDARENIDGFSFLHRAYPDQYVRECILDAAAPLSIRTIELFGGSTLAYVVNL